MLVTVGSTVQLVEILFDGTNKKAANIRANIRVAKSHHKIRNSSVRFVHFEDVPYSAREGRLMHTVHSDLARCSQGANCTFHTHKDRTVIVCTLSQSKYYHYYNYNEPLESKFQRAKK